MYISAQHVSILFYVESIMFLKYCVINTFVVVVVVVIVVVVKCASSSGALSTTLTVDTNTNRKV